MTRIDLSNALAALHAARLTRPVRKVAADESARSDRTRLDRARDSGDRRNIEPGQDAAARLAARVRTIHPDDPGRGRKAFRMFLEISLVAALGQEVVRDPAFQGLVDEVQRQMEGNPGLGAMISDASRILIETSESY